MDSSPEDAGVTLKDFRKLVRTQFGGDLSRMTPANVREFLDTMQPRVDGSHNPGGRIHLNEPEGSYEAIVRDFLRSTLDLPTEQAVVVLWLYCLELVSASVSDLEAERFRKLFEQVGTPDAD